MTQVASGHTTTEIATGRNYVLERGLVPFLPDDVALQCLLRVPAQSHPHLRGVCRKWRDLVNSRQFYELRQKEGTTGHCVCLLQATQEGNSHQAPVFGVSLLNDRNLWGRLPQLPDFDHHSLPLFCRFASVEGNLVVLGGWDPSTTEELRSVYIFSFSSRTWRRGADMPTTRSFFSCGALNGQVLVAGGHDADKNALRSADCYNLTENSWKSLPNMSADRDECAGAVLHGKFYVISGYSTLSQGGFCSDAEIYDPELNKWTTCTNMWALESKPGRPSSVIATAGSLYAIHHNELVRYSARRNFWQVVDAMPGGDSGIAYASCATAFGNKIIVTGPSSSDGGSHRTLLYTLPSSAVPGSKLGCKGRWEMVPVHEQFMGVAQVSCVVEV